MKLPGYCVFLIGLENAEMPTLEIKPFCYRSMGNLLSVY